MNNEVIVDKIGEDAIVNETKQAENSADYMAYLKLIDLKYSHEEAAAHLGRTPEQLNELLDQFEGGEE